ncbi:hypothetical protein OSTOST_00603 [Ostertagia ostertagi]
MEKMCPLHLGRARGSQRRATRLQCGYGRLHLRRSSPDSPQSTSTISKSSGCKEKKQPRWAIFDLHHHGDPSKRNASGVGQVGAALVFRRQINRNSCKNSSTFSCTIRFENGNGAEAKNAATSRTSSRSTLYKQTKLHPIDLYQTDLSINENWKVGPKTEKEKYFI